jgi:hypothetical protein
MIEKYRYKLPCGHHMFIKTSDIDKLGNNAYKTNKPKKSYRCQNSKCRKKYSYKIDKKTGEKITL